MNTTKKLELRMETIKKEINKNEKIISELTKKNNDYNLEYKKIEKVYYRLIEIQDEIDNVLGKKIMIKKEEVHELNG